MYKVKKYKGMVILALPIVVFSFIYFVVNTFFNITLADKRYGGHDAVAVTGIYQESNQQTSHDQVLPLMSKPGNPCSYAPGNRLTIVEQDTPRYYKYLLLDSIHRKRPVVKPYVEQTLATTAKPQVKEVAMAQEEEVALHQTEEVLDTEN